MQPLLELREGAKELPGGVPLFAGLSFSLASGASLALVGRSGSGKSTLLACLGLMDKLTGGQVLISGADMTNASTRLRDEMRRKHIGFVFQRFALISHLTVLENVMAPLRHSRQADEKSKARALTALEAVEVAVHYRKRPHQLSGGEQQRVAIARALVTEPDVILADEPTGSLDWETGLTVMNLLRSTLATRRTGLVLVTHDRELAGRMDDVLELGSETISPSEGKTGRATSRPLS